MYSVHTDSNRDLRQNVFFFLFFCFCFGTNQMRRVGWVPGTFCQAKRKGMKGGELPAEWKKDVQKGNVHASRTDQTLPPPLLGSLGKYFGTTDNQLPHESRWLCEDRILTDVAPPESVENCHMHPTAVKAADDLGCWPSCGRLDMCMYMYACMYVCTMYVCMYHSSMPGVKQYKRLGSVRKHKTNVTVTQVPTAWKD